MDRQVITLVSERITGGSFCKVATIDCNWKNIGVGVG